MNIPSCCVAALLRIQPHSAAMSVIYSQQETAKEQR